MTIHNPRLPIPTATRTAVLARAAGGCEACGMPYKLELHHLHYNSQGCEVPADLMALCRHCHAGMHRDLHGHFWADPEQMRRAWGDV
jgi:5-methylcytosine-specific restriction endonuclease McrA